MSRESGTYDIHEELEIQKTEGAIREGELKKASCAEILASIGIQDEYFVPLTEAELAAQKFYQDDVMKKIMGCFK